MKESKIEKHLRDQVNKMGGDCIKSETLYCGFPDRMVMIGGRTLYVETKTKNGALSPIQRYVHKDLRERLGIKVHVLWSIEDVNRFLHENI